MNLKIKKRNFWHCAPLSDVQDSLGASEGGLTSEEVLQRQKIYGLNALPRKPTPNIFVIFLRQFKSPLIFILGFAALVSLFIGEYHDAAFIAFVLLLNSLIGGFQEWRAEKSSRALERFLKIGATVSRDREVREIDAESLVPGDILWLEPGLRVPADTRLIQGRSLEIDESPLTGESLPTQKDAQWIGISGTPLAERRNMIYAGTTVVRGRAKGIVVATGTETAIGQLALDVLATSGGKPPLILRLEKFTRVVGIAVVALVLLVTLIGLARGYSITDMFFFGVALGVAAVPEGLLVAITIALAIATRRMAERGVIVRQLAVVEGLGSCTLIASDKTGTLTCNQLTVREIRPPNEKIFQVSGEGFIPEGLILWNNQTIQPSEYPDLEAILRVAVLCNEADLHRHNQQWVWRGDPTDVALLSMAKKAGWSRENILQDFPQLTEVPFEPERQFAATFHRHDRKNYVFVKGAFERVITMCRPEEGFSGWEKYPLISKQMAEKGFRVLAFAEGTTDQPLDPTQSPPEPSGLRFLGWVGMIDPLRPGARQAVEACQDAGVKVAMVTGDHPMTALAIAKELGLASSPEEVVTGKEIKEKSMEELKKWVPKTKVFARVIPHDKLRIVEAAQEDHEFVAVTGDGVNDAPALRTANIGIAMGKTGTDVARDASDIVISDDNFATIVAGIEEGRIAYANVRNVIYLLVSQGAAEILVVALGMGFGLPLPLLPVQLLWLNLVTNGIQDVALAFEPGLGNELKRPPRPTKESIFNRLMVERTLVGSGVMGIVGFLAYYFMVQKGWSIPAARNGLLLLMVLFENVHLGNCRSEIKSVFSLSPLRSPLLLMGALAALLIHVVSMYLPLGQKILQTQPINLSTWVVFVGLALTVTAAMELHKWRWNSRTRKANPPKNKK